MKIVSTVFGLWIILFCSYLHASAQSTAITEQDFGAIKDSAYRKTSGETYRKTLKSKHFRRLGDLNPYFERSVVTEFSRDSFHEIVEDKNEKGVVRKETIEVKGRKYVKENNGPWKFVSDTRSGNVGAVLKSSPLQEAKTSVQVALGKEMLNGRQANAFRQRITREYDASLGKSISEETIWIDEDGRYLRTESNSRLGELHVLTMTVEYEYDPKIKISAPKIR